MNGQLPSDLFKRNANPLAVGPDYPAMAGLHFAVDSQAKNPRQSERGSNMKAGAGRRRVIDRAGHFLARRAEFYDSTFVRRGTEIFSAIKHCRPKYYALCAISFVPASARNVPGNMYVRVRLQE